jgi:hypothetical protein
MAKLHMGLAVPTLVLAMGTGGTLLISAGSALLTSAGDARAQQADSDRGYATQPFTPPNFQMPEGSGCAGDIARWKAVQENDYASGNVGLKIYNQIKGEIARAEAACSAGHDSQASAMVSASKRRHGYPG